MEEDQVEINGTRVDSEDLMLLNDYIDLLLDPTLPIEQFDANNYVPVLLRLFCFKVRCFILFCHWERAWPGHYANEENIFVPSFTFHLLDSG